MSLLLLIGLFILGVLLAAPLWNLSELGSAPFLIRTIDLLEVRQPVAGESSLMQPPV